MLLLILDLELSSNGDSKMSSGLHPVKKTIQIKLKQPTKSTRGRPRKGTKGKQTKKEDEQEKPMEADDEIIETPIFKPGPGEPTHQNQRLQWNHKVNLIGEKVVDPLIHCCEKCLLPILIYGRMIPCKHVFCFSCAKKTEKTCVRCEEPVQRIEQSALGTVFVCSYGAAKHSAKGCRRTYLSQRDLQAHIYHRHLREPGPPSKSSTSESLSQSEPSKQSSHSSQPVSQYSGGGVTTPKSQNETSVTPILEQFTSSVSRNMTPESHHAVPARTVDDNMYQRGTEDIRMQSLQQPNLMTHMPPLNQPPPALPPQGIPAPHLQLSSAQAMPVQPVGVPPPQMATSDTFQMGGMSMPGGGGRTNLITVQLQDDTDYRRRDQPPPFIGKQGGIGTMPSVSFSTSMPPPGHGMPPQQPFPTSMALPMHQGPPPVSFNTLPPGSFSAGNYSSPSLGQPSPVSSRQNVPISHPPPGALPHPRGPPMSTGPPPGSLHPTGPPPRMTLSAAQSHLAGPVRDMSQPPPRFPNPHGPFDDSGQNSPYNQPGGQNPRGPWSGPPPQGPTQQRGPPPRPGAPMHPPHGQFY